MRDDALGDVSLTRTYRRRYTAREGQSPHQPETRRGEETSGGSFAQKRQSRSIPLSNSERDLYGSRPARRTAAERSAAAFRMLLVVVVVISLGVVAIWAAVKFLPERIGSSSVSTEQYTPDIEPGEDKNGNSIHTLTYYGEKGDIIYIPELQKNYTIESTNVRIAIPDRTFTVEDPNAATITVELHPVLYPLGKKSQELEIVSYAIQIPLSPLAVLQPEDGHGKTYQSFYLIKVQVDPGSTVSINGNDVTDLIDAENIISHNVEVEPIGSNRIGISVSTPGYRTHTKHVVVERPYMDIPIEISTNAPISSTARAVTITGKTTPGASLQVSPSVESVSVEDDGEFTIKIKMTKYGENAYTLTASMPGKESSSIDHSIVYSPNLDEYSRNAWKMEYDHVRVNQSAFQGRIFMCPGKIVDTLSDNPYIFTFNVGTEEKPKLIAIEMIKTNPFELDPDKQYDVYADLDGDYEGYLRFNGRFFLESDTRNQ